MKDKNLTQEDTAPQDGEVAAGNIEEKEETRADEPHPASEKDQAEEHIRELNDKYLRLYSEFENFRKRTQRERADLIRTAGEEIFVALLPVLDDFERAVRSMDDAKDVKAVKEGVTLIHTKLKSILEGKGLKGMDAQGESFDVEKHEAISQAPAPDKKQKGKVLEVMEKGYTLHDKVIRYAKVIIGQ